MTKPVLKRIDDFKVALKDYEMSEGSKQQLRGLKLAIFISVTSAGRNTIMQELAKTGKYEVIVSDTTRPMRQKNGKVVEANGVEYWFRSEEDILKDIQDGKFLEAEVIHGQQVSGISTRELIKASRHGKVAVNDMDFGGVHYLHQVKPDTIMIMVLPPRATEWMKRLKARHDMSTEEFKSRLKTAKTILSDAKTNLDYKIVINDDLQLAVTEVRRIVEDDKYTDEDHRRGLVVVAELLEWVNEQLK